MISAEIKNSLYISLHIFLYFSYQWLMGLLIFPSEIKVGLKKPSQHSSHYQAIQTDTWEQNDLSVLVSLNSRIMLSHSW